jgi:hypothetical protein
MMQANEFFSAHPFINYEYQIIIVMKKNIYWLILLCMISVQQRLISQTPTTAYDFVMDDCNGNMHHLFSELDSGNVVVMEFFMISCSPCIDAGHALDAMTASLKKKYGSKVRFYQMGFTKSYTCTQIKSWVATNGFATSVPFDSGDVQVAYYGGMGMPTIAVAAGKDHKVLFTSMDFKPKVDTATISSAVHTFFGTNGIFPVSSNVASVSVFPNPTSQTISLLLNVKKPDALHLTLMSLEGQLMADLYNETLKAGTWEKSITLPPLKNGTYFLQGELHKERFTRKITILNQ